MLIDGKLYIGGEDGRPIMKGKTKKGSAEINWASVCSRPCRLMALYITNRNQLYALAETSAVAEATKLPQRRNISWRSLEYRVHRFSKEFSGCPSWSNHEAGSAFSTTISTDKCSGAKLAWFAGTNASGIADGTHPPTTWNVEKAQNVRWKTAIPGLSHSSPIVWGNKVFVITAISGDPKSSFNAKNRGIGLASDDVRHTWRIYCLDKTTGRIIWDKTAYEGVPKAKRHLKATQANSTPVTDGKYVVALFGSEGLSCYDVDGKLRWSKDLGVLNPGLWDDPSSSWGHASSPVIYRDLVIVQADGHAQSFIAAFDLKNGKQVWRVERGEIASWSTDY